MDVILLPLIRSSDESDRELLLSDLILVHAAPIVRSTLRQRLGLYVNALGVNSQNHDAEDLYHDVIAKLLQLLNDPQLRSGTVEIKNFRQYVARVATNACHDYLRAKSPARSRLKNSLRDLLDRHQAFATWRVENETLCGFAARRGGGKKAAAVNRLIELREGNDGLRTKVFRHGDIRQVPLVNVVHSVLTWVAGPVELDELVGTLAVLLNIRDFPAVSLSEDENRYITERIADSSLHFSTSLDLSETLRYLWSEILQLPPNQRDTFCLSFEDDSGDDLFSLLLDAGIVTLPQIAQALSRPLKNLLHLWQQMPMDSAGIAEEMKATRQQVNKWRFRALRQLEKMLIPTTARK